MKPAVHQYEDKLLEFAYGELSQSEAGAVDAHVRGCPRCTEALSHIRGVRTSMARLEHQQAPDAGLESLLALAAQQATRNAATGAEASFFKRLFGSRWMASLASVGALLIVGVVAFRASKQSPLDPATAALEAERRHDQKLTVPPPPVATVAPASVVSQQPDEGTAKANDMLASAEPQAEAERDLVEVKQKPKDLPIGRQRLTPPSTSAGKLAPADDFDQAFGGASDTLKKESRAKRKLAETGSKGDLTDDYSNAAQRGAQKPVAEEKAEKKIADKEAESSSYGLGYATEAPKAKAPAVASAAKDEALASPAPTPAAPPVAEQTEAKPKSKASLGLKTVAAREQESRNEVASTSTTDALSSAQRAAASNDRLAEVEFALAAIRGGAVQEQRLEALRHLCDAYEALGQPDRADPFCDALLTEFPRSGAAQSLANRRSYQQTQPVKAAPQTKMPAKKAKATVKQ